MSLTKLIQKVSNFENLTEEECCDAFQIILKGGATPAQISAFLIGLRMKGETVEEITAAAKVMRSKCRTVVTPVNSIDTCGTGGDCLRSYNISTAAAFVVAGAGVPVAKHGNKAASSLSGSADVLSLLGVNIAMDVKFIEDVLEEAGICFMMATSFHHAVRYVAPVRKELAIRTIFNILGPLSNPANVKYQLLGVYSKDLVEPLAHVLKALGCESAWVVHGADGMDELTTTGSSYIAQLEGGNVTTFEIAPEEFSIERVDISELRGGMPEQNATALKEVLTGGGSDAYRDIVLLNAAAALKVAGKAANLQDALALATESIDTGAANKALLKLVEATNLVREDVIHSSNIG